MIITGKENIETKGLTNWSCQLLLRPRGILGGEARQPAHKAAWGKESRFNRRSK